MFHSIAPTGCNAQNAAHTCVTLNFSGETFQNARTREINLAKLEASAFRLCFCTCMDHVSGLSLGAPGQMCEVLENKYASLLRSSCVFGGKTTSQVCHVHWGEIHQGPRGTQGQGNWRRLHKRRGRKQGGGMQEQLRTFGCGNQGKIPSACLNRFIHVNLWVVTHLYM